MKICIYTLGCKVNQYESEGLSYLFEKRGYKVVLGLEQADAFIINTCAVTSMAEHKSRGLIAKCKKLNPDAKIYICGCSSQLNCKQYLDSPSVSAVVGTQDKTKLVELVESEQTGNFIEPISDSYCDNYQIHGNRIRSFIKIQDGCNNFCSYCIIPYTRGRERSRTIESVLKEVEEVSKSSKEIVLVGINIAGYGKDLPQKPTLAMLVKALYAYPQLRLRFSSFEMGTLTPELLEALKGHPNFCPFFHIALQSASDKVLKDMNRHYTVNEFNEMVKNIRKTFPNAGISTDIIVGYPTESDQDFENSLDNISKINFSKVHIFPYSKREGTRSAKLKDVTQSIVKKREERLNELTKNCAKDFYAQNVGKTAQVLFETTEKGYAVGYTPNYIKCYATATTEIINTITSVQITDVTDDGVMAEIIK